MGGRGLVHFVHPVIIGIVEPIMPTPLYSKTSEQPASFPLRPMEGKGMGSNYPAKISVAIICDHLHLLDLQGWICPCAIIVPP